MALSPRDVLDEDLRGGRIAVERMGLERTRALLHRAAADLEQRLHRAQGLRGAGTDSFTAVQLRAAMAQVHQVIRQITPGLRDVVVGGATESAEASVDATLKYLDAAHRRFSGAARPLGLDETAMFDEAAEGARASVLRRLASSGEPVAGADEEPHRAKAGILERYGVMTLGHFEEVLQRGRIAGATWADLRNELVDKSPFLQAAPGHWAERIVRTELMGASNRAHWEGIREADAQLGDMVKVLSATFDDRTAADSYAVHGQIRRPAEAFESWFGLYQHPPNRPNDREVVVPHRVAWPIPPYLKWKTDAQVHARWKYDGRKGNPPPRPLMTTVPLEQFGKAPAEREKEQEKERPTEERREPAPREERVPEVAPEPRKRGAGFIGTIVSPRLADADTELARRVVDDVADEHPTVHAVLARGSLKVLRSEARSTNKGKHVYGWYQFGTREMSLGLDTPKFWPKGILFNPGNSWSTTEATKTWEQALRSTFIHELGHHVHDVARKEDPSFDVHAKREHRYRVNERAAQKRKATRAKTPYTGEDQPAISKYAMANHYEYFAESFAAYHLHPDALLAHDPGGHALVERALSVLGVAHRKRG